MIVEVLASAEDVAKYSANIIEDTIRCHPGCAIALPTGKTPLLMYKELISRAEASRAQFEEIHWFALDDFLCPEIPEEATFGHFLKSRFVEPAGLPLGKLHTLNARTSDPLAEGSSYEASIVGLGGLKLAVLGLGNNGHIAFNEPGTSLQSRTGPRQLTERSRRANAYLFGDDYDMTPCNAITMGIATILEADRILVLVTGESKADVLALVRNADSFDPLLPASALALHKDVIVVADIAAANTGA